MTRWVDAVFVRGGTSRGLCFRGEDVPGGLALPGASAERGGASVEDLAARDALLCAAMGSPDPYGRQLDGLGSGSSSTSKVLIVARSARDGIDLDYTVGQVQLGETWVDYSGNCGNMSAAVVPYALEAGLLSAPGGEAADEMSDGVREFTIFNTNTAKQVVVRLMIEGGRAAVNGDTEMPGVAGTSSPVDLVYPESGGSRTTGLLPTGVAAETLEVTDPLSGVAREIRVSLLDAAIPLVLVAAASVELTGAELPAELDANAEAMALLDALRREGAVRMGLSDRPEDAPLAVPKVAVVAPAAEARLIDGTVQPADAADLLVRTISMDRTHNAVPGTGAMCLAAAAQVPGTVVAELLVAAPLTAEQSGAAPREGAASDENAGTAACAGADPGARRPVHGNTVNGASSAFCEPAHLRIGTPSGVVTASARLDHCPAVEAAAEAAFTTPRVIETALTRTARVLMRGQVAIR